MIDISVQRALLLKVLLEAVQKETGIARSTIEDELPAGLGNQWTRSNATQPTLVKGMELWAIKLRSLLDDHPGVLPDNDFWNRLKAIALTGVDTLPAVAPGPFIEPLPEALSELGHWVDRDRAHTLAEVAGCWYLFRLTSQTDPANPEVTVSVLNIRPETVLRRTGSKWTEFALFPHPVRTGEPDYRVNGVCTPSNDHLHFLGLLDKRSSYYPSSMSLRYYPGGRTAIRQTNLDGLMYITNSHGRQISAPVFARYEAGSEGWLDDDYREKKGAMLKRLGSHPMSELEDIFPVDEYQRLRLKTEDGLIFEAD